MVFRVKARCSSSMWGRRREASALQAWRGCSWATYARDKHCWRRCEATRRRRFVLTRFAGGGGVVTREIMASSGEVVKGLVHAMAAVLRPPRRTVPDTSVQRWTAIAFAVTNVIVGVWRSSRRAFRGYQQPRSDNHDDKGGGGAGTEDGTGGAGKASDSATRRHGRRPAPASFYLMCMRLLYHI